MSVVLIFALLVVFVVVPLAMLIFRIVFKHSISFMGPV